MICDCPKLPDLFGLATRPAIESETERLADGTWYALHECKACRQKWRIDHPDQGQIRFVLRMPSDAGDWQEFDPERFHKELMLRNRGGTTGEPCIFKDCSGFRVNGEVYCLSHLYSVGVRE